MRITWRTLKDGSLVASSKASGMRYRISDFGDATWLLESGEVGLMAMERYASRAHAISVAIKGLLATAAARAAAMPVADAVARPSRVVGAVERLRRRA